MKNLTLALFLLVPAGLTAGNFLVENGEARAEIVISGTPPRSVRAAAQELQDQIAKISGARLPIVTNPATGRVKIFVGESTHTTALGVSHADLKDGAYRIASGPDWLVLIGDDTDFNPIPPFAKSNSDIPRAQEEWEALTKSQWGMPGAGLYKYRIRLPGTTGKPDGEVTDPKETLDLWGLDERGSFNAVCGFLYRLGARWYLPGELGEVLPALRSIPLPDLDETVRPDFSLRQFNFRFGTVGEDSSKWVMRLGTRNDERWQIAHGLAQMTSRDSIFAAHPDWFALYGGKRDYTPGGHNNQLCYSNEELFEETVRYARAQLDRYQLKSVSIMPPDGYTAICQCPLCQGKDDPARSDRGHLSDYVWDFVNRVAKEVAKTHPDRKVLNCAYGAYTLPPENIEKLEPNVVVCIVGGRRPVNKWIGSSKGDGESAPEVLRANWLKKTDNPLLIFENYPFTGRGWYLPSFTPHLIGDSVQATKGNSLGEDIWLSVGRDFDTVDIGFNHFLVYFTARMYWGGQDADVDELFREYCRLFYGPAETAMLEFFTYCEENWREMEDEKEKADHALALFASAQSKVTPEDIYGKRLALIDDYLNGLRRKSLQLSQKRGPVPFLRLVGDAQDITIDGNLNDTYWENCPVAARGTLRELQTGQQPIFGTSVKAGWEGNSVVFAIRCEERSGEKPNIAATTNGDTALWYGDAVELEIATETHSYYQIAISPSGAIVDSDRGAANGMNWDAKAEIATQIADGYWTAEIRLPITQDENDPLHQIIGRKPTPSLPWHINICRQRIREDGSEFSALSPTGTAGFHEPLKFARFYAGKSTTFEADESVTDFIIELRRINQSRNAEENLPKLLALAKGEVTDFQKSTALEQAAIAATLLKRDPEAESIIAEIPLEAARETATMRFLLARGKAEELISRYETVDLSGWPFWKRGESLHLRGRAHYLKADGEKAERDLAAAMEFTSDARIRDAIQLNIGQNRERNRNDDTGALASYEAVVADATRIGGSDEYSALQGMARILTKQGRFEDALKALARADVGKLQGTWRENILKSISEVNEAKAAR